MTYQPTSTHRLVDEYLAELDRATADLPASRRAELLTDVSSHIAVARAEADPAEDDDQAIRRILHQLGEPQEIAATAVADLPSMTAQSSGRRETATILLLLFGGFLAGIGWLIGVALLWSSQRWTRTDKLLATLLVPGGLALAAPVAGAVFLVSACTSAAEPTGMFTDLQCGGRLGQTLAVTVLAILVIAPIYTAIRLTHRKEPRVRS